MIEVTRDGELTVDLPGLYLESGHESFYIDFRNGVKIGFLTHSNRYSSITLQSRNFSGDISWIH